MLLVHVGQLLRWSGCALRDLTFQTMSCHEDCAWALSLLRWAAGAGGALHDAA